MSDIESGGVKRGADAGGRTRITRTRGARVPSPLRHHGAQPIAPRETVCTASDLATSPARLGRARMPRRGAAATSGRSRGPPRAEERHVLGLRGRRGARLRPQRLSGLLHGFAVWTRHREQRCSRTRVSSERASWLGALERKVCVAPLNPRPSGQLSYMESESKLTPRELQSR